jgi:hypothetical protein
MEQFKTFAGIKSKLSLRCQLTVNCLIGLILRDFDERLDGQLSIVHIVSAQKFGGLISNVPKWLIWSSW